MQSGHVSWRDYAGVEGYGVPGPDDLADLRKALTAGQSINSPGTAAGEGFPLRVESLENTLKVN